jgi:hypothetical protein
MKIKQEINKPATRRKPLAYSVAAVLTSTALNLVLGATPAQAANFQTGEVNWSADMTLGASASFRVEDPDTTVNSPNIKSDTTFDKGLVSNVYKITGEFGADWRNYFAVANVNYTYDWMIMQEDTDRGGVSDPNFAFGLTTVDTGMGDDWNNKAEDVSGSVLDLLDAYVGGTFVDDAVDLRIGWQVINWGEGLFFLDGVAEQTPLNIGKLVLPGSELKEAFVGVNGFRTQWAATDILSVDAYVQFDWEEHTLPGVGTYYGDDIAGPGGREEWSMDPVFAGLRGPNNNAGSSGQWGVSGRAFVGDVEVGLYYSRYHEKFPLFTFASNPASETLAPVLYFVPELNGGLTPDDWASFGVTDPSMLIGFPVPGGQLQQTFLEDSDLFGASVAFSAGPFSVNGEIAYRPDRPLALPYQNFLLTQDGDAWKETDTVTASAHLIWLGGQFVGGIDSQFGLVQLGVDYIDDAEGLDANNVLTEDPLAEADDFAWGAAASWDGTWQAVANRNIDLTLNLFVQYDFSGNSHFWGNFAEDRVQYSVGLTSKFGNALEANINYAGQVFDDSAFETQDTVNVSFNYKF